MKSRMTVPPTRRTLPWLRICFPAQSILPLTGIPSEWEAQTEHYLFYLHRFTGQAKRANFRNFDMLARL